MYMYVILIFMVNKKFILFFTEFSVVSLSDLKKPLNIMEK